MVRRIASAAAVYASSGYLLFVRQGTLLAQAFDLPTLTLSGSPFSLAAGMSVSEPPLVAAISTSAAGPFAYRTGSAGGLRQVAWFDRSGNYHSEALHVVERYTRTGPDHLLYEATIEDPKVFSRPWTISMPLYRRQEANARLLEYECYAYLETKRDAR